MWCVRVSRERGVRLKNEECVGSHRQEVGGSPYLAVPAEARDNRHPGRGVGVTLPLLFVQVQQPGVCRVVSCVCGIVSLPFLPGHSKDGGGGDGYRSRTLRATGTVSLWRSIVCNAFWGVDGLIAGNETAHER